MLLMLKQVNVERKLCIICIYIMICRCDALTFDGQRGRRICGLLGLARFFLCGAFKLISSIFINPQRKASPIQPKDTPPQLTNSYFSLASPAPAMKSEFVVELAWLTARFWALGLGSIHKLNWFAFSSLFSSTKKRKRESRSSQLSCSFHFFVFSFIGFIWFFGLFSLFGGANGALRP